MPFLVCALKLPQGMAPSFWGPTLLGDSSNENLIFTHALSHKFPILVNVSFIAKIRGRPPPLPKEIEHEFLLGHFNDNCETSSMLYYKKHLIVPFSTYLLNPFKECTKETAYGLIPMYHVR